MTFTRVTVYIVDCVYIIYNRVNIIKQSSGMLPLHDCLVIYFRLTKLIFVHITLLI
jgi:hypothetical protein